jgi:hypothetical protein
MLTRRGWPSQAERHTLRLAGPICLVIGGAALLAGSIVAFAKDYPALGFIGSFFSAGVLGGGATVLGKRAYARRKITRDIQTHTVPPVLRISPTAGPQAAGARLSLSF